MPSWPAPWTRICPEASTYPRPLLSPLREPCSTEWRKGRRTSSQIPCQSPWRRAGAAVRSRRSSASLRRSCRRARRVWDDVANVATEAKKEQTMKTKDYTASFTLDQSPEEVFDAINSVCGWWSEQIGGSTDKLGAEFRLM